MPSRAAGLATRALLPLVSVAIFLATGEAALRVIYRGGGTTTLGAPGGGAFHHETIHDQQRGRLEWGDKPAGVPRVMIVGDSITWGTGVRHWQDTWPEQLALQLERQGRPHQFAVLALPGREIDAHIDEFKLWAPEVQPDVFIYQWYVNDLEVVAHRPPTSRLWHRLPWHTRLTRLSYLYYFLDNRLQMFLPPPERSYVDYILNDFVPGNSEWTEFERDFHNLAARVHEVAPRRLLLLYPQVPFSGPYPLQPVHDRMTALAHTRTLAIPPVAWQRSTGAVVGRADGRWKQAAQLPAHAEPNALVTRGYYANRALDLTIAVAAADVSQPTAATVRALDSTTGTTLATATLPAGSAAGTLHAETLHLAWPDSEGREVQIAIGSTTSDLEIAAIDLAVDYGFDVLDLKDSLNTFNTHVSIFDAHPNPAAHKVVAEAVAKELAGNEGEPR